MQIADGWGGRRKADEIDHHGFAHLAGGGQQTAGYIWRRWLGNQYNDIGLGILCQIVQTLQHGAGSHFALEVAAAGADSLRYAPAQVMDLGGDSLKTGSGSADQPNGATPHPIGKTQANAVDDRSTAIRAHHE